jgi:aminopeptidase N
MKGGYASMIARNYQYISGKGLKYFVLSIMLMLVPVTGSSQTAIDDSGGPLMPEQACYDVRYYDLALSVNPADSSINGSLQINADIVQPLEHFVVDLDTLLTINRVVIIPPDHNQHVRLFQRRIGKVWIYLGRSYQPGESVEIKIYYHGKPRAAALPPWDGGFTWSKTRDGSPWIATSCQGEGPDIWWPAKDHISDEPDSMGIHIRVAAPLTCASNGRLRSVENHDDNTRTFHWFVSTPINNYNVALNIAPYELIEDNYQSVSGDIIAVKFWVLPEDYEKGKGFFPQIIEHLNFFERMLGPYPFRADKYGVAQTPYLGMEHQTIIAYGANFDNSAMTREDWGFDALHHHELSHEWWGNLVTARDWKDMWIHEGFGTYMQALYCEELKGIEGYHAYMSSVRGFNNDAAVAPRESKKTSEIWKAPIYAKGAWALHSLRYLIGEEALKKSLRLMAYPTPEMEKISAGAQTRFVTTDDFLQIAEQVSGKELDWFFEVYLRQPELPELAADMRDNRLSLSWKTPEELPFPMPVDVEIDDRIQRVEIGPDGTTIEFNRGVKPRIDPQQWVLFELEAMSAAEKNLNEDNYPKAKEAYQKALYLQPGNKIASRMMEHIRYALRNEARLNSDFFSSYQGRYEITPNYIQTITREGNRMFIQTGRRGKYRIYPLCDTNFTLMNYDLVFTFVKNTEGKVEELITESKNNNSRAKRIE